MTRMSSLRVAQAPRNKRVKISICSCIHQRVFIDRPKAVWYLSDVWQEIVELMRFIFQLLKIFFTQLYIIYSPSHTLKCKLRPCRNILFFSNSISKCAATHNHCGRSLHIQQLQMICERLSSKKIGLLILYLVECGITPKFKSSCPSEYTNNERCSIFAR